MLVSSLLGSCFLGLGDGISAAMMFSDSSSRVGQLSLGLLISSGAGLQKIYNTSHDSFTTNTHYV